MEATKRNQNRKKDILKLLAAAALMMLFLAAVYIFASAGEEKDISENRESEQPASDMLVKSGDLTSSNVIKASYSWEFVDNSLNTQKCRLTFNLLRNKVNDAAEYLDYVGNMTNEELGVDYDMYGDNLILYQWKLWREIFIRIYEDGYPNFETILKGFDQIFKRDNIKGYNQILYITTFVQNITYERPGGLLDLLAPLSTLAEKYGDCDTKSLLLYIILERMGIDCVMLWSYQYKHAALGIAINSSGDFLKYEGKKYYFFETTYPGWAIGQVPPSVEKLNYWYVVDLDHEYQEDIEYINPRKDYDKSRDEYYRREDERKEFRNERERQRYLDQLDQKDNRRNKSDEETDAEKRRKRFQ